MKKQHPQLCFNSKHVGQHPFEHICMNNIKKIYQHAGKCDAQQNLKDIIDAVILYTTEGVTYHSHHVHFTSDYALPHCNCVLRCCSDCLWIDIPDQ